MKETLRLFIAVELPKDVKEALSGIILQMRRPELSGIRWTNSESIHLTLKFLGNVPQEHLQRIEDQVSYGLREASSFTLTVDNLGAFPNLWAPRALWIGVAGDLEQLKATQQKIAASLEPIGFVRDERPFSPHLTLARLNERAKLEERRRVEEALGYVALVSDIAIEVASISLMKSTLLSSGAVHERLASFHLKGH